MKIRNTLLIWLSTFILGTAVTTGTILANTNTNADQLELLTQAVKDDRVDELQRTRGDINIQAGTYHSGAIIGNSLYMWGLNDFGQLGTGDKINRNRPTRVTVPAGRLTELALGHRFSGFIVDSKVYTWGLNDYGQLGVGSGDRTSPTLVGLPGSASSLALGQYHSGAIVNGTVYMWGRNDKGQIGDDTYDTRWTPVKVHEKNIKGKTAVQLSLGFKHSGAIFTDPEADNKRKLYTWGLNSNKELGYDTLIYDHWEYPCQVKDLWFTVYSISFGGVNSSAIANYPLVPGTKSLNTWGDNEYGQLGLGYTSKNEWVSMVQSDGGELRHPDSIKISNAIQGSEKYDSPCTMIATATKKGVSGILFTWGMNSSGQIGNNTIGAGSSKPVKISVPSVSQIAVGQSNSMAVINGKIYTWGSGVSGELGNGQNSGNVLIPTMINLNESYTINLNASNKVVYNYTNSELINIIEASSGHMNLPTLSAYSLSNTIKTGSVLGGNGRLTTRIDTSFPITTDITINGFLPVRETALAKINPIQLPENYKYFEDDTLGALIYDAKQDASGTKSKLAQWIMTNSKMIIGDTTNTYTQDFPQYAEIIKVDGFDICGPTNEDAEFNIHVNKYYEKSGNNLILSTSSTPVKIVQKVVLSGLLKAVSYEDCINPTTRRITILKTLIDPQTTPDKFFKAITGHDNGGTVINRLLLGQYIDTRFIPADAIVELERDMSPGIPPEQVNFFLKADKYYLDNMPNSPEKPLRERITFMIVAQLSSISLKDKDVSKISTGDALDDITPINNTIPNNSQYFNFTDFPSNTVFTLNAGIKDEFGNVGVIENDNENGILKLSINADKHYSLDSINPINQNKLFEVTINGFMPVYNLADYPVASANQKIELNLTVDEFFAKINRDDKPNRTFIDEYLDLRAIPANAILSIDKMEHNSDNSVSLTIKFSKYYDKGGKTITDKPYETSVLFVLPSFDLVLIISLTVTGVFLMFLIICIIIAVRNKHKLKIKN